MGSGLQGRRHLPPSGLPGAWAHSPTSLVSPSAYNGHLEPVAAPLDQATVQVQ